MGIPLPCVEDKVIFSMYSLTLLPLSFAGLASSMALAKVPKFWYSCSDEKDRLPIPAFRFLVASALQHCRRVNVIEHVHAKKTRKRME